MKLGARQRAHAAPREYRALLPAKLHSNPAGAIIEYLLPPPIGRQEALDLFDGRASFTQVTAWRHGASRLPQWAAEILDRKLIEHMAPSAQLRALLPSAVGPGQSAGGAIGAQALRRWRLTQQKQKPGS